MVAPRTLFEKVWADHVVVDETADTPAVLYIDLHLIHEVTTPQAFSLLGDLALPVRRPDRRRERPPLPVALLELHSASRSDDHL